MKRKNKKVNVAFKAPKMFLSGMKEGTICEKLCISPKDFDTYLKKYRYRKAIEMSFEKVKNEDICHKLKISKQLLDYYRRVYYTNKYPKLFEDRNKRQCGRSPLVSEIYWKYRINKRLGLKV
jgi:hypothetical protein